MSNSNKFDLFKPVVDHFMRCGECYAQDLDLEQIESLLRAKQTILDLMIEVEGNDQRKAELQLLRYETSMRLIKTLREIVANEE